MARTKNPRMRRKRTIRAKWHRRWVREAAGIKLPSGVPRAAEPVSEVVAAEPPAPAAESAGPSQEAPGSEAAGQESQPSAPKA